MNCRSCKKKCVKVKRPNPVFKGKFIHYYYCNECGVLYHVAKKNENGEEIVCERKLKKGDRVEGGIFKPLHP